MTYFTFQTRKRHLNQRHTQTGFTLVEVLLASLLGIIVVGGVYQIFVNTSTHYAKQIDHVQAQSRLRFAVEFIKADLRNFGRLSILNTTPTQRDSLYCGNRSYTGLTMYNNDQGTGAYELPHLIENNQIRPDRLRLLIDQSNATPLALNNISNTTLNIAPLESQLDLDARRLVAVGSEERLKFAYTDSLVRITQLKTGKYDVLPVSNVLVNNLAKSIRVDDPPCTELDCSNGGCVINPIKWVEYAIVEDERDTTRTQLVRHQLDLESALPIPNTELILADYAVDFQVWGDFDTRGHDPNTVAPNLNWRLPQVPTEISINDDQGNWVLVGTDEDEIMNQWPHRLRGLSFLIAVRNAQVDPNVTNPLGVAPRSPQERMKFQVSSARGTGFAHVSTLTGSIDNENLYRGD